LSNARDNYWPPHTKRLGEWCSAVIACDEQMIFYQGSAQVEAIPSTKRVMDYDLLLCGSAMLGVDPS
jgi:hypothetical protein